MQIFDAEHLMQPIIEHVIISAAEAFPAAFQDYAFLIFPLSAVLLLSMLPAVKNATLHYGQGLRVNAAIEMLAIISLIAAAGTYFVAVPAIFYVFYAACGGALVLALVHNHAEPFLWFINIGLLCNVLVRVANGGMPVIGSDDSMVSATKHIALDGGTQFVLLADIVEVPLGSVLFVLSMGDLFIISGIALFYLSALIRYSAYRKKLFYRIQAPA